MVETLGAIVGVGIGVVLVFLSFRRYWRMTPAERAQVNQERRLRNLERKSYR